LAYQGNKVGKIPGYPVSAKVGGFDKVFWDQKNLIIKNNLSRKNMQTTQFNLITLFLP
jgi:hypothetical protein